MNKVTLELEYSDMVLVEWALEDFRKGASDFVTQLQNKEGPHNPERATLMKIYTNRIRNAKRVMHEVSAVLITKENLDEGAT